MSLAGKMFKAFAKETAESVAKSVVKKEALEALKKTAQQEVGTGLSAAAKDALITAAKKGVSNITRQEAKEAAAKTFGYTAQAVARQNEFFRGEYRNISEHLLQQRMNGQITEDQAWKAIYDTQEQLEKKALERQVASTGSSETMLVPRHDETSVFLNKYINSFDKKAANLPVENVLYMMKESTRLNKSSWLSKKYDELKKEGKLDNMLRMPMHFIKNGMLLDPISRTLDGCGNIMQKAFDLSVLESGALFTQAGHLTSKFIPYGALRDMMASPGIYQPEVFRNITGMVNAATDYVVQGGKNSWNFIKANKNGMKETVIGRNARKIDYQYNWNRQALVSDVFVPRDITTLWNFVKKHPGQTALKTYEAPGFGLAKLVDEVPGGAFRAGNVAQNAYHFARLKLEQSGKPYTKKDILDLEKVFVDHDQGNPISPERMERFYDFFGRNYAESLLDLVSEQSSYEAAKSTFRTPPETMIGKWASDFDKWLLNSHHIGMVYDAVAPLARFTFHQLDRAVQDSPLIALKDLFKEFNSAYNYAKGTGKAYSGDFYKAFGKLVNATALYIGMYKLYASGRVTGSRPKDKKRAAMFDELGLKENSIIEYDDKGNVSNTISYEKIGGAEGYGIGTMIDMIDGINDAMLNYEDPDNPYGANLMALNVFEVLLTAPFNRTVFGTILDRTNIGGLVEQSLLNLAKVPVRVESNIEELTGMKPSEYIYTVKANYDKERSDFYLTARPKVGMFGEKLKDGESPEGAEMARIMNGLGVSVIEPKFRTNITFDNATITLSPMQKTLWQEALGEFYIEENGYKRKTSALKMMQEIVNSETFKLATKLEYTKDATGEIVKAGKATKMKLLTDTYNDACNYALKYLLSYSNKIGGDKEKQLKIKEASNIKDKIRKTKQFKLNNPPEPIIPSVVRLTK